MASRFGGMTVNERLHASGLMADFDEAVERGDFQRVRSLLAEVDLNEASIGPILERLGLFAKAPDRSS
jgi:hypothetical protein